MRIAPAFLGAGACLVLFLAACGKEDSAPGSGISTTDIVSSTSTKGPGGGTPKAKTNAPPIDYKTLVKRRGKTPVIQGTNQFHLLYHFTGTNRYTGLARMAHTNGLQTLFRIEHGLFDGYVISKFPDNTNRVSQFLYLRGLKNGREYHWHKNGRLKLQGEWTNGMRTGFWYVWHDDGTTNRVDMYKDGKYLGKHKTFVSVGLKRVWQKADFDAYSGIPQASVIKGFGSPDKIQGAKWMYEGVKVTDAIPNKQVVTLVFTMQKGKVATVSFAP